MLMVVFTYMLGASACVELQKYEDAVRWCDDGLAVSLHCEVFLVIRMSSDVPSGIFCHMIRILSLTH